MNLDSKVIKGFLAFILVLPLSPMANASCSSADAERLQKVAQAVVGSFPALNYSVTRRARFRVSADDSTGALNVKFSNVRRTLFEQPLNIQELAPDVVPGCKLVGRPAQGRPANGLFLRLSCEAPQSTPGCAIVIQPGLNRSRQFGWTYRVTGNRAIMPAKSR
ncbi:MAG: hypothetical protein NTX45_20450 [Proteobacteria bacterium]|nr:hypothetical protein [Pseudomonadota bacterium]